MRTKITAILLVVAGLMAAFWLPGGSILPVAHAQDKAKGQPAVGAFPGGRGAPPVILGQIGRAHV